MLFVYVNMNVEMKWLKTICGARRVDWAGNDRIIERCGSKKSTCEGDEEDALNWFGQERMTKRVYMPKVEGMRKIEKPRRR